MADVLTNQVYSTPLQNVIDCSTLTPQKAGVRRSELNEYTVECPMVAFAILILVCCTKSSSCRSRRLDTDTAMAQENHSKEI